MNTKIKILIVEHDPNDLELIHRELKKGGINYVSEIVQTEQNYGHALKNYIPDIILSDYSLPSFDGPTAFKMREKMAPDTPFIFVSGTIGEENSIELIKNGVTDYALKDRLFTLTTKINRALKEANEKRQKRAVEKALNQSEANLRTIFENTDVGYYLLDKEANIVAFNKKVNQFTKLSFGFELQENQNLIKLFAPERQQQFADMFSDIIKGNNINYEVNYPQLNGTIIWYSINGNQVYDSNGQLAGICVAVSDITFRKEAYEILKKTHREISDYKLALDESSMVSLTDEKGIIQYANDNLCKISKYSPEEFIGQDHRILNSGYHSKEFFKNLWRTISQGKVWSGEMRNRAKDGTFYWIDATIVPFLNEDGKPYQYVAIRNDITGRKKAEERLRKSHTKLEEHVRERTSELVEANTALEAFSYSVSHDLRSPVRSLIGFAKIINKEHRHSMNKELNELFSHIESSSKRMNAIIDDLLTLAKFGKEKLHKGEVDMTKLFSSVWDNLLFAQSHKATLELEALPKVEADCSMLEQVIINLLSNAIKYSSKKENPQIKVGYEQTAEGFAFYVKDNGAGFDMKYYDRLFGAFHRLHSMSEFEGTGVGLTLVKRIIEKHGGKVWAEAKVDEGATFYFTLQIAGIQQATTKEE